MGLAIGVGSLAWLLSEDGDPEGAEWMREDYAKMNEVLREHDLPAHHEPDQLPQMNSRAFLDSFSYSFLHYLRRAYAYVVNGEELLPCETGEDPTEDDLLDEEMDMLDSHLLCHSDCEGYYLPIDFDEVIIDRTDQDRVPGGLLGSSYKLKRELEQIAPVLGITLQNGELSNAEAKRVVNELKTNELETGFWKERCVWMTLFEAARLSIEHNSAISFQ